mmetsp:Transcript_8183/g.26137  ORF Transcript_8183/g.26137 Transcript_8183/m.26137 type:complete len:485 (-) Transcript_8183:29-1483(-)
MIGRTALRRFASTHPLTEPLSSTPINKDTPTPRITPTTTTTTTPNGITILSITDGSSLTPHYSVTIAGGPAGEPRASAGAMSRIAANVFGAVRVPTAAGHTGLAHARLLESASAARSPHSPKSSSLAAIVPLTPTSSALARLTRTSLAFLATPADSAAAAPLLADGLAPLAGGATLAAEYAITLGTKLGNEAAARVPLARKDQAIDLLFQAAFAGSGLARSVGGPVPAAAPSSISAVEAASCTGANVAVVGINTSLEDLEAGVASSGLLNLEAGSKARVSATFTGNAKALKETATGETAIAVAYDAHAAGATTAVLKVIEAALGSYAPVRRSTSTHLRSVGTTAASLNGVNGVLEASSLFSLPTAGTGIIGTTAVVADGGDVRGTRDLLTRQLDLVANLPAGAIEAARAAAASQVLTSTSSAEGLAAYVQDQLAAVDFVVSDIVLPADLVAAIDAVDVAAVKKAAASLAKTQFAIGAIGDVSGL